MFTIFPRRFSDIDYYLILHHVQAFLSTADSGDLFLQGQRQGKAQAI